MPQSSRVDTSEARILIVDDEPEILSLLEDAIRVSLTLKVVVSRAANGLEALEHVESTWFDAIVTDIKMPKMSGFEFLAALRGDGRENPVIVLTGVGDQKRAAEALRLGCYAFVHKPFSTDRFGVLLKDAVQLGMGLRERAKKVENRLLLLAQNEPQNQSQTVPTRRSQLRNVLRSIEIGNDGLHRSDVCEIPVRKKVSRGS